MRSFSPIQLLFFFTTNTKRLFENVRIRGAINDNNISCRRSVFIRNLFSRQLYWSLRIILYNWSKPVYTINYTIWSYRHYVLSTRNKFTYILMGAKKWTLDFDRISNFYFPRKLYQFSNRLSLKLYIYIYIIMARLGIRKQVVI